MKERASSRSRSIGGGGGGDSSPALEPTVGWNADFKALLLSLTYLLGNEIMLETRLNRWNLAHTSFVFFYFTWMQSGSERHHR